MPRRPELGTAGASVGTRAVRAGRHPGRPGGREGQATGGLPLRPRPGLAAGVVDGMLFGVMAWAVLSLTLVPVMAAQAAPLFPTLLLCLRVGGTIGPGLQVGLARWSPWRRSAAAAPAGGRRVVVLGGGFGGVGAARRFEQLLPWTPGLEVTLVSQSNYLLFTPMLAEVAAGSVEAGHVSVPLRAACPRTRFRKADVLGVDLAARTVYLRGGAGAPESLPFDHLVLALGGVPSTHDRPGVAEVAWTLKTLEDAVRLREHVLGALEQADLEPDPRERRRWLTFVVAGGGFAGTEAIAGVFDLVHSVLRYFPQVRPAEPRFVLVHSRDRILPELSGRLAGHAHRKLRARGIELRLGVTVTGASEELVALSDGERLPARTLIWAAGVRPSPLAAGLPLARRDGAVVVEPTLRARGTRNVWALGDCAHVPDLRRGGAPCPPTAQHAVRQGRAVAENVVAAMTGRRPEPFRFRSLGFMVPLGHQSAAAELRGLRFSGLLAWLLWRGVYLWKLPRAEKRLRVLLDWSMELFFPRDTVLLAGERRGRVAAGRRAGRPAA